jgi:hypothetical protein
MIIIEAANKGLFEGLVPEEVLICLVADVLEKLELRCWGSSYGVWGRSPSVSRGMESPI